MDDLTTITTPEAIGEGVLGWVEATLDAILDARVSHDRSSTPGRESL